MPTWAVWICNLAVIAILVAFGYFLRWTGWQFALGLTVGFFACYFYYRCDKQDAEAERRAHFTD